MRAVFSLFVLLASFSANANSAIVGTVWSGLPKIAINGVTLCSPDPKDNPQFPPLSHGSSWLKFNAGTNGWFWIEEHDQCSSWFGFQTYLFHVVGNQVFDPNGVLAGILTSNKLELSAGFGGDATIQKLIFEIQANGSATFYAKFLNKNKPGAAFEQSASYKRLR
jgi:hypothetical protein